MLKIQTYTAELAGTSYEIGYQFGKLTAAMPQKQAAHTAGMEGFGLKQVEEAVKLFDRWCPGLTEELCGFADALKVKPEQIFFYGMTYLLPRCSHIALLPSCTAEGKPLLARSYEFSHEAEDFCLIKTSVTGKYSHMGTSVLHFGRDDGFNEHGLAVTMSSCGFPVGALPYMRAPKLKGLQFWAVTRALLENCKDVTEALKYLEGMPIAYNLNMLLLDKAGNAALVETMDGYSAVKQINPDSLEQMLYATNHALFPQLQPMEPQVMAHSVRRYEYIEKQIAHRSVVTQAQLKEMLLAKYPDGLCCHYFEEYFGTTKSMVISPSDGIIDLCWGGRSENGWYTYDITKPLGNSMQAVQINLAKAAPGTYDWQPLT
ncbi:C45 family autoproteolytic acyltransferase/hydolase [Faecalicatena contorta]|uniref:Predicted choloylglycine hydrolase n=1 Tax=Faecalicatena contorta TaxID=39482 RepID=A0A315ZR43_9FIRM|nr:C45 family peptidase [Faecalicatena contorta]PWJ48051.1 putative choloylglycine hydrolase [Faecalicatena contorta]SUQ15578.1 Predicted choloylglycine hydrolase [Faecalicatena contorta]